VTGWAQLAAEDIPSTLVPPLDLLVGKSGPGAESLRVLDIGCGAGATLLALLEAHPTCTGLGYDINADAIAHATARAAGTVGQPRATFTTAWPSNERFGLVLLTAVLTAIPTFRARQTLCNDAAEALAEGGKGGTLLVADFMLSPRKPYYADRYTAGAFAGLEPGSFNSGSYLAHHTTREELALHLHTAGLTVLKMEERPARTRTGRPITSLVALAVTPSASRPSESRTRRSHRRPA
jgi:SAM-dependent methyltransferase